MFGGVVDKVLTKEYPHVDKEEEKCIAVKNILS
jgi:hypothetical protein